MYTLIQPFVQLSLFSIKPQDLPASQRVLVFSLICYGLVSLLLALPLSGFSRGLAQSLVELLLLTGFTLLALRLRNHTERSTQTLTALAGSGAVLSMILLPFLYWFTPSHEAQIHEAFLLLNLLIIIWLIAVYGYIFHHALSVHMAIGVITALCYLILVTTLLNRMFSP